MYEKINAELNYLGYVKTINEKVPMDYAVVTDIPEKYFNKTITLYRIHDGSTEQIKVKGKKLEMQPLKVGQIIKTIEVGEEPKWKKDDMGEWYKTGEKELILKKWSEVI